MLPLVKKDGMPEIGKDLYESLLPRFAVQYDEKDAIDYVKGLPEVDAQSGPPTILYATDT